MFHVPKHTQIQQKAPNVYRVDSHRIVKFVTD